MQEAKAILVQAFTDAIISSHFPSVSFGLSSNLPLYQHTSEIVSSNAADQRLEPHITSQSPNQVATFAMKSPGSPCICTVASVITRCYVCVDRRLHFIDGHIDHGDKCDGGCESEKNYYYAAEGVLLSRLGRERLILAGV